MGRSNHSNGCFGLLVTISFGAFLGMVALSILLGVFTISISRKENGIDFSLDVVPVTQQLPKE